MPARRYMHMNADAHRDQKPWVPLELELETVTSCLMWELKTKLRISEEQSALLTDEPFLQVYHF